jgi:hypothetical protein
MNIQEEVNKSKNPKNIKVQEQLEAVLKPKKVKIEKNEVQIQKLVNDNNDNKKNKKDKTKLNNNDFKNVLSIMKKQIKQKIKELEKDDKPQKRIINMMTKLLDNLKDNVKLVDNKLEMNFSKLLDKEDYKLVKNIIVMSLNGLKYDKLKIMLKDGNKYTL